MGLTVLRPPEIVETTDPVLFLAGPIDGADNWQAESIVIAYDYASRTETDLTIASPRFSYRSGTYVFEKQMDWDMAYRNRAKRHGSVMFWLARQTVQSETDETGFYRSYARTTRFELAEDKRDHERDGINLVVGIEDGFSGEQYIRWRFEQDCPDIPILDNLEETCLRAIQLATAKK